MESVDAILAGKYPAKAHAANVAAQLKTVDPSSASGTIYLQGQQTRLIEDNDEPQPFRQRRHFFYLSGCDLADCHLTYHVPTSKLTLFIPPLDPSAVIWSGLPVSPADALKRYDVDNVLPSTELAAHLAPLGKASDGSRARMFAIRHFPTDCDFPFEAVELEKLQNVIDECRVIKDAYEIACIRKANQVTAAAHEAVMKQVSKVNNERELEAIFLERSVALGCKKQAYHGIFGAGENAATLHYVHNDQDVKGKSLLLMDAGVEYECYCADVTRTMPVQGKFNAESKGVYETVLKMQNECFAMVKAGARWEDVHVRAHEVAIEGLLRLGILAGNKKEIFEKGTSVAFFPHGLGHYLGMDTHDTGGHPNYEDPNKMFKYLRTRGTLPEGSVITVEPGIYFCRFIVEPYMKDPEHSKFIDGKVLERYWEVGGVRIEDDVLVTKDGFDNLTSAPKEVAELEKIASGQ